MLKLLENRKLWMIISVLYIIVLFLFVVVKIYSPTGSLLFTRELIMENREKGYWNINLVPFETIKSYFNLKYGINYINIVANTFPFILLSFLLSLATNEKIRPLKVLFCCLGLIIFFEVFQLVSCLGSFDVDDIIMNFFSCIVGVWIYLAMRHFSYKK